ncbi:hypothetical protein QT381_02515 [Galbitalea sp. SE-J8]|uniref:hypothetical protein n=1 Tax=Galbitalea sp. SE-J8 TaxID=3054952 RepID=UPI00259CE977|nr:hypothetical protein [Galbitalea sp. SE-J8]MDM4761876.1 hypothetical protein [Galbitalea sp. SE-J8]
MPTITPLPPADGSLWPLLEAPNEQKVGTDIVAAVADRYEHPPVADLAALNTLTGAYPGMTIPVVNVGGGVAGYGRYTGSAWKVYAHDSGYIAVSAFFASWSSQQSTPFGNLAYRRVGKTVELNGRVVRSAAWTAGETICTLPVGFRPATGTLLTATSAGAAAAVWIDAAGVVTIGQAGGAGAYVVIGGSFLTAP